MRGMRRLLIATALLLAATTAVAFERQSNADYKARRQRVAEKLGDNGVLLLWAGTESPEELRLTFRQDDNFYYLTGFREPAGALMITGKPYREVLFLPVHNTQQERWTGKRLGPSDADALAVTGFDRVEVLDHLHEELAKVLSTTERAQVYTDQSNKGPTDWLMRVNAFLGAGPAGDARKMLSELRSIKDAGEIALIKKASEATVAAHIAAMKSAKPGMTETQLAGVMVGTFMQHGCEAPAYLPIVGSGFNSTVLHYGENSGTLQSGDVIVMDVGGEYSMYATDVTRTIPVSGKFTPRQREIYEIVLAAQRAAADAFVSGTSTMGRTGLQKIAYDYINSHGKDSKGDTLGKYFIHGLGHPVGLNVHDPGDPTKPLAPGMVFTLEPGIYIPEEKLGVRIEDTYVVAADGKLVCLSCAAPKNPDEVERAMTSR
jgi:Xaa-Pro aminopeptidase